MVSEQEAPPSGGEYSSDQDSIQLVTFELDQKLFGIDISTVIEVVRLEELISTPGSSGVIEGVVDIRGDIIPVIDLRKRFQMTPYENYQGTKIILVTVEEYLFGTIVDKVDEVSTFAISDFLPPPLGANQAGNDYTLGLIHKGDQLLFYLDMEKVINLDQLLQENS